MNPRRFSAALTSILLLSLVAVLGPGVTPAAAAVSIALSESTITQGQPITVTVIPDAPAKTCRLTLGGAKGEKGIGSMRITSGAGTKVIRTTTMPKGRYRIQASCGKAGATWSRAFIVKAAAPVPPRTCIPGGPCLVGDTGPGGGLVFYAAPAPQAWGQYLESAPSTWTGGTADPRVAWCSDTTRAIPAAVGTAIGTGAANTSAMLAGCASGAANSAVSYTGGGRTDWFLPSIDELTAMWTHVGRASGGFAPDFYWSSTDAGTNASAKYFDGGGGSMTSKANAYHVRPVRAF